MEQKNKHSSRQPPMGWSFIDWEDNCGRKWRDCVPTSTVKNMQLNRGMKLIKIINGGD